MATTNTNAIPQALLRRKPFTTKEQFSTYWFEKHAAIVLPYFLANGVDYYAQIHDPILTTKISAEDLNVSEWDGAAELKFKDPKPEGPEGANRYFQDIVLADERKFLVSEALEHYKMVDGGTVTGDRKVIIEDGKVVYELCYLENVKIWQIEFLKGQFKRLPYPDGDFTGQTIIITARLVILACRNEAKGWSAKATIEKTTGRTGVVEVWPLDLASFDSVKEFCKRIEDIDRVDIFIANAGIATPKFGAKFPERSASNVFDAFKDPTSKSQDDRYPTSKLLEILIVRELTTATPNVVVNSVNPGYCKSELQRYATPLRYILVKLGGFFVARSTEVGSRTLFAGAVSGEETNGKYMSNCAIAKPVAWIDTEHGLQIGNKVWVNLLEVLDTIQPGIKSWLLKGTV
ncbi:hypothetical protein BLS_005214 [Venturia inaequalis]|uniref:EthD domain-containing protein n=1 Tax=Venturia inaequalis TaxID=5025 RepID=A0A8H3UGK7_VENIN|nr:hypothetical protein BLS_005214 [Venturia inaequalis]